MTHTSLTDNFGTSPLPGENMHAGRQRVLLELAETPSHPSVSITSDSAATSLSLAFGKACSAGEPRDLVYRSTVYAFFSSAEEQGQFQKKKSHNVFPLVTVTFSAAYSVVVTWRALLPFVGNLPSVTAKSVIIRFGSSSSDETTDRLFSSCRLFDPKPPLLELWSHFHMHSSP